MPDVTRAVLFYVPSIVAGKKNKRIWAERASDSRRLAHALTLQARAKA
jgi:hypothetical protein